MLDIGNQEREAEENERKNQQMKGSWTLTACLHFPEHGLIGALVLQELSTLLHIDHDLSLASLCCWSKPWSCRWEHLQERKNNEMTRPFHPGGYIPTLETKLWERWKQPVKPRSDSVFDSRVHGQPSN